jgi:hypothetical protein
VDHRQITQVDALVDTQKTSIVKELPGKKLTFSKSVFIQVAQGLHVSNTCEQQRLLPEITKL